MAAALPVVLLLPLLGIGALIVRGVVDSPRFSIGAAFATLATGLLGAFVALTRQRSPRAGVLAACHALAWAPVMVLGAWEALDAAIVYGESHRCGTGLMSMLFLGLPIFAMICVGVGVSAGALLARCETDGIIRIAAVGATSLTLLAFVFALASLRSARPDPDTYLGTLEPAGEISADTDVTVAGRSFHYGRVAEGQCQLTGLATTQAHYSYPADQPCPALRVRIDRANDVGVVDALQPGGIGPTITGFRPSDGSIRGISATTLASGLAPPIGWTVGAGLGGAAALGLLFLARRHRRRAASLSGYDARHAGDGWVTLESGETLRVDVAAALPIGDVVLAELEEHAPTYRTTGTPTFGAAFAGTLDELRRVHTDRAASLYAVALASAVLAGAPLLVARAAGLL